MASDSTRLVVAVAAVACLTGCGSSIRRFPLRDPLWKDTDLAPVSVSCRKAPTKKDLAHVSCAPEEFISPLAWDGIDNSIFRPFTEMFAVDPPHEALDVNSLDEVPDSAWFTNRLGRRTIPMEELVRGACDPEQLLTDLDNVADGTWVIDDGKPDGSSPGFRVRIPGKGKYMLKSDGGSSPERPSAASTIGAAVYQAAGFNTSCEQIVYIKRSVLKLTPGLKTTDNTGVPRKFDEKALAKVLDGAPKRGELIRMQASAWLPGHLIGPFRYEKTRRDDPNDIISHEDRRDLRGGRLVAAWIDHFDARQQNTMDTWIVADAKANPESSPGFVRHYYLDTSDTLGSEWDWDLISRRLGHSYLLDWSDIGLDFLGLGVPQRVWDTTHREPGLEIFGYFNARDFVPEDWVNEYPNRTFSRMTEHDGAWMARILARFTPSMVEALAGMGQFSNPKHTAYLTLVLQQRLQAILLRYLTKLSPLADVRVDKGDRLCAKDLARAQHVRSMAAFRYSAQHLVEGREPRGLEVTVNDDSDVCVTLPHVAADGGAPDDAASRYVVVRIANGVAKAPLDAHLYDLGPAKGYRLAGLERPAP